MATRDQYFTLLGQIAEIRTRMAQLLASQRPQDIHAREIMAEQLATLEDQLQLYVASANPLPADGGIGSAVGIGPAAGVPLGGVPTPIGVPSYNDAVVSERLYGVADLYYCYQLERLGLFRAVRKLEELFRAGQLRLDRGTGATGLYRFDRKEVLRYTRKERMQAYRRVFGYTNAAPPKGARANESFHALFMQFTLHNAQLFRDKRISETIRPGGSGGDPSFGSIAIARRAGLDLRSNLKRASYGDVNVLTVELLQLVSEAFDILSAPDVLHQFGTDDGWDTLEEVMERYLGEPTVVSQRSRMAETGREIIQWLAQGYIQTQGRTAFEALAQAIAEPCEEWLTSAQALGMARPRRRPVPAGPNVVRFPQAKSLAG